MFRAFDFELTGGGEPVIKTALRIASTLRAVPSKGLSGFLRLAVGSHAFSIRYLLKSSRVS